MTPRWRKLTAVGGKSFPDLAMLIRSKKTTMFSACRKHCSNTAFNPGPIDGVMGKRTRQATREFQAAKGLLVDGIAGSATWAELEQGGVQGGNEESEAAERKARRGYKLARHIDCGHCRAFHQGDRTWQSITNSGLRSHWAWCFVGMKYYGVLPEGFDAVVVDAAGAAVTALGVYAVPNR